MSVGLLDVCCTPRNALTKPRLKLELRARRLPTGSDERARLDQFAVADPDSKRRSRSRLGWRRLHAADELASTRRGKTGQLAESLIEAVQDD